MCGYGVVCVGAQKKSEMGFGLTYGLNGMLWTTVGIDITDLVGNTAVELKSNGWGFQG